MTQREEMSLTTPLPKDSDVVFPGENWFLYWKTSQALWKSKLESIHSEGPIIVPINWSFHSETGDDYDFAQNRAETDLGKLVKIAEGIGREIVFFLPLTPLPFVPNGGIPHFIARTLSINSEGMAQAVVDAEGNANKLYSFFDSRVFECFMIFIQKLGHYFEGQSIGANIWGIECGYFQDGKFVSYIEDRSRGFEQSFTRYLDAKKQEKVNEDTKDIEDSKEGRETPFLSSGNEEKREIQEFCDSIRLLYQDYTKEVLGEYWEGNLRVSFIGGSTLNFLERITRDDLNEAYSANVFTSIVNDVLPSSALLPPKLKDSTLGIQLNDFITGSYLQSKFKLSYYSEDEIGMFYHLAFFEIFESNTNNNKVSSWSRVGLHDFLGYRFKWAFKLRDLQGFNWDESLAHRDRICFFNGEDLDKKSFNAMLKLFMNGGKVVLDRRGIDKSLLGKLEMFFMENSLTVQKINFHTIIINNVNLGDGRLIIFGGDKVESLSSDKVNLFWNKLIETFNLTHLDFASVEGVEYCWRTRRAAMAELNYEEIRRLSLYNRTSYKKRMKINLIKNLCLMKILDEVNVKVRIHSSEIELEFLPGSSLSLDFGLYS